MGGYSQSMTEASKATTPTSTTSTSTSTPSPAGSKPVRVGVRIPGPLRPLSSGADEVAVTAKTVGDALDAVMAMHPGLRRHLRAEDGSLREHVNVFRNEDDVRYLDGERTAVTEGDTVTIVPSIAGG